MYESHHQQQDLYLRECKNFRFEHLIFFVVKRINVGDFMEWLVFGGVAWLTGLLLVPIKYWKKLWPLGMAGMMVIFPIDTTLIDLGAIDFSSGAEKIFSLPISYWLSYIPGGILFGYYCPIGRWQKFIYILIVAFVFLIIELIMVWLGYFYHLNWNPVKSYLLNVGGFTIMLSLAEWLGLVGKEDNTIT